LIDENTTEVARLAQMISGYLEFHPHAADTLEGVAKWWFPPASQPQSLEQVAKVLESLVDQGIVKETSMAVGKIIYSAARNP
jgi:Fe2+ or Zn2+ uptake regulation protein